LGSVVALAVVVWQAADDQSLGSAGRAGAADDSPVPLTFFGPLPAGLAGAGLREAAAHRG
jgi:hypothetical protein